MPTTPVTDADFRAIGERYLSTDINTTIDRLTPLAKADIAFLPRAGYGARHLAELAGFRVLLAAEVPTVGEARGTKKSARTAEHAAVRHAKSLFRTGFAAVRSALSQRVAPPGEPAETTQRIADAIGTQLNDLTGAVGNDTALLQTRLTALVTLLGRPEIAIDAALDPDIAAARATLVADVTAAAAALPAHTEAKKGAQQASKKETVDLDVIDGKAYTNLKALCAAGREYWIGVGNKKRADEYHLNDLHSHRAAKASAPKPVDPPKV